MPFAEAFGLSDDTPTVISKALPRKESPLGLSASNLRGRRLAHFELLEPIGVGGMAAVLKARDEQLDRFVALKILPPEMASDPESVLRFQQEGRAAARLDHENIARVFYCGQDQQLHFIAFEFVEGQNLKTLIERRGRLSGRDALSYMLQVAAGLAHAAARGVVHRDIKPSNIIITPTGRAKLVDMGLARSLGGPNEQGLTHSGVTLGTFDYISPEQALEPREADVRSDIYSLGCTFYHAMTGQPPVPEGTAAKKLKHHQAVEPIDPRQLNPEITDEGAGILARMMAKDPKHRYQRAEHLVQHLIQVVQKLGGTDSAEGPLFVDAALPSPPRAQPWLWCTLGLLGLLVLVVLTQLGEPTGLNNLSQSLARPLSKLDTKTEPPPNTGTAEAKKPDAPSLTPIAKRAVFDKEPRETTAKAVAQFLQTHTDADQAPRRAEVTIKLGSDIEFLAEGAEDATGWRFRGKKLTLEAKDPHQPITLKLKKQTRLSGQQAHWSALFADCDELVLQGVRIVLETQQSGELPLVGLHVKQAKEVKLTQCEFVQSQSSAVSSDKRITSLLLDSTRAGREKPAEFLLTSCAFTSVGTGTVPSENFPREGSRAGQEAITVVGSGCLRVYDCAFSPHLLAGNSALFRLKAQENSVPTPNASSDEIELDLRHSSLLLAPPTTVFRTEGNVLCQLNLSASVFARAVSEAEAANPDRDDDKQVVLLKQSSEQSPSQVTLHTHDSRFYRLGTYWHKPNEDRLTTWQQMKDHFGLGQSGDRSRELVGQPWKIDKNDDPARLLEQGKLREAFQLNPHDLELRLQRDSNLLVGIDKPTWGVSYNLNLPRTETTVVSRTITLNPDNASEAEFTQMVLSALRQAQQGDVIVLHYNGKLKLPRLNKPDLHVTLRSAGPEYKILLQGEDDANEKESALFKIQQGKLHLEGLEVLLQAGAGEQSSLVQLLGEGQFSCKNCVLTLDRVNKPSTLSIVHLEEPSSGAKPAQPERRPTLRFENCLVRGEGDLVSVGSAKPFDLVCKHSLLALTGNLLSMTVARDVEVAQVPRVDVQQVTAYLGGHFVKLRAGKELKSMPLQIDRLAESVLVSATGTSFVHLDVPDTTEDKLKSLLTWKEVKRNVYSNFGLMIDQEPREVGAMPTPLCNQKDWRMHEPEAIFRPALKLGETAIPESLVQVLPAQLKVKEQDLQGFGVDIDRLLRLLPELTR